jgi:uncharacterized protein YukJ
MAIKYGVLRARPDRWKREDGDSSPHLQIRVLDDAAQPWRIAVNVQSNDGSDVVFWVVDPLVGHPILGSLASLPSGFSSRSANSAQALDFVKAPMFDWTLGRALPPSGSSNADDLQDLLALYLDQCKAAGGEVYAYGAKFDSNLHKPIDAEFGNTDGLHGVHDIHMNQGNVGAHSGDNGPFHDGGLLLAFPDRVLGLLLGFQTQRVPTDANGDPASAATPLSGLIGGVAPQPPGQPVLSTSDAYLERALLNPTGADPGHEVVVIGSLATTTLSLHGWRLVDRNGRVTTFDTTIGAGDSSPLTLDGSGVQLGNKGGNLILQDAHGNQVDTVTYSAADADREDRFVRFRH